METTLEYQEIANEIARVCDRFEDEEAENCKGFEKLKDLQKIAETLSEEISKKTPW
jgi:hypothetical protein